MPITSVYVVNTNTLKFYYPYVKIQKLPKEGDTIEILFKRELIVYKVLDVNKRQDKCFDIFVSDNLYEARYKRTVNKLKRSLNIECEPIN